ncbi:MAG TPA: thiamine pyrophosphate-binding protein, partial [Gaiellaceae bacterium]|nr:thiamine pyrophosphate-binding protein [Gaiellaceae bacterium]
VTGRPAVLNVTTGPGGLNAFNGVFGAFTDSTPMVVIGGQSRRDTMSSLAGVAGLRQLGDQEARIVEMACEITVSAETVTDPAQLPELLDRTVAAAISGRPGPAWLDVPVDVQGAELDADPDAPLPELVRPVAPPGDAVYADVLARIDAARRPLILAGTGIRAAGCADLLVPLAERLNVPVATAWTHDTVPSDHPLYAGRPGTIGTRAGNFVAQSADLILVLGSRLNVRQVSYNWAEFAPHATIVWVDVDEAELQKPYVRPDVPIVADLRDFLPGLLAAAPETAAPRTAWLEWCRDVRARFEPKAEDYPARPGGINPYHLVLELGELLDGSHVVACGDATACIVPFQTLRVPAGLRLFSNSGSASMGYDLPAALGAATAAPDRRVVCLAGDGSVMMNLQELQTLAAWAPDVLLVILDNGGYLSIRQTQSNFFGREFGASPASGVTFPDFARVAASFDLPVTTLDPGGDWRAQVAAAVAATGPRVCVAPLDREQEFEPRLRSRMRDGKIMTPALDDMYPHLDDETLAAVRESALAL